MGAIKPAVRFDKSKARLCELTLDYLTARLSLRDIDDALGECNGTTNLRLKRRTAKEEHHRMIHRVIKHRAKLLNQYLEEYEKQYS